MLRRLIVLLVVVVPFVAACSDDDDESATTGAEETGATAASESSEGTGGSGGAPVSLEGTVNDEGTEDLGAGTELEMEADDFYFGPTFVTADAAGTVTVMLHNEGEEAHTFTIDSAGIDTELAPGDETSVEVTLPDSGPLEFYCRFHRSQGMQGAFSVGG